LQLLHSRAAYYDPTASHFDYQNFLPCTTFAVAIASITSLLLDCKILRPNVLTLPCREGGLEMIHRTERLLVRHGSERGCKSWWFLRPDVQAVLESCGCHSRLRVDGWQSCGGTYPHTAHEVSTVTIHYRHHPFYGEHGTLIRRLRRYTSDQVVIQLRDEVQAALPSWRLDPVICQQLSDEPQPRLAIAALLELRHLLDSQPLLTSRVVASRKRTAQQTGGDHAQSQLSASAPAQLTIPPTRPMGADT
jgi:hypothetical protein